MFDKATREKFRFESSIGSLSVEDLWDLPLQARAGARNQANLDDIARALHKRLNNGDDVSFVVADRKSDPKIQAHFDIVKHIIDVKLAEERAAAEGRALKQKASRLKEIIAKKQDAELEGKSLEELNKELAELGA